MTDFLDTLAQDAKATIATGYYESPRKATVVPASLKQAIAECRKAPVISEVKAASPSAGTIRENMEPEKLAQAMARGGAVGISVLTEPKHFNGSLGNLSKVRQATNLPILMKDIIINPLQLATASRMGANAVLLIQALFDRGYSQQPLSQMIGDAHARNLEVLKVDLNVTKRILKKNVTNGKLVVSESGICLPADLRFLRECGAHAFLIGSAVMLADDVEGKVREFVNA